MDSAASDRRGCGAVALFHEIPENPHEEGGGADVEALVKGLARHARMVPVLEVACDLVQRRQAGGHGAEQGLEKSGGGEFAGFTNDQPSLACDEIEVGQARSRAAGGLGFRHTELAGPLILSSFFRYYFYLNR